LPHDGQCDGRCEERIKAFQKLEAKAMATATMPRRKALKWNKNLPRMRYGRVRDLEYAHRDNVCARCARYLNKELARFKLLSILVCRVWLFVNTFGYFVYNLFWTYANQGWDEMDFKKRKANGERRIGF
jgi:hypothetical protein